MIVENLCSLPLNVSAAHAVADAVARHRGRVVFRHHDLPWQRRNLAHLATEFPPRLAGALHATINLRSRRELEARGFTGATTIHNYFDLDPAPGDRDVTWKAFGFADELVVLQPSRAIERKNVPGAVRLASYLARRTPNLDVALWIAGPAEDGYADTLARVVERSDVPVTVGRRRSRRRRVRGLRPRGVPLHVGRLRQPGDRVGSRRGARAAAFPYPVLAEIIAAGVRCFSTEQPDVLVRFLAEPESRRETYFDVNLRRTRVSFSLADLPGAIEQAFRAHGWTIG